VYRLNKVHSVIFIVAAIIALTVPSEVQAEDSLDAAGVKRHSIVRGLGIPAGFMDWSANMRLSLTLSDGHPLRPEITFHETFSAKKSEGEWMMVNVLAGYFLVRYNFAPLENRWVPFVSGGGGAHYILSRDGRGFTHDKTLYHYLSAKAHGFAGLDWNFKSNKFLVAQVRFTYPSDLILDAAYIEYGIRF
jgi:hypothetical protein